MVGDAPPPTWLAVDGLPSQFGPSREEARRWYRSFVHEGVGESIWQGLRQQIYLGDEAFVTRMQSKAQIAGDTLSVPQAQRGPPAPPLAQIAQDSGERNAAIVAAYATGAYTYREIAEYFGVHLATVGRLVRTGVQQCENWPFTRAWAQAGGVRLVPSAVVRHPRIERRRVCVIAKRHFGRRIWTEALPGTLLPRLVTLAVQPDRLAQSAAFARGIFDALTGRMGMRWPPS